MLSVLFAFVCCLLDSIDSTERYGKMACMMDDEDRNRT